jgi:hypothetical protein
MPFPTFAIGPSLKLFGWMRDRHQDRRKVKLTVHRATKFLAGFSFGDDVHTMEGEYYFITVTNASRERDIVVTHVWLDTDPRVDVVDTALPVRLRYSQPWETSVPVEQVPEGTTDVEWRARCQLAPDDKVVKSRPRRNVPPVGTVPRG